MIELLSEHEYMATVDGHFGFRETPFGVTPDPRFFYSSSLYLEGLAALVYGIRGKKGLMLLTGEVGTGKTILLRKLMRQLDANVQFVFISSSHITSYGLVELMVHDLGLANKEKNRLDMIQELTAHLLAQLKKGQTVALLIDEGQNLSDEALEGLCGLSNLETDEEKLLQIILVGQPELATTLGKPSLRRLKQRIAIHHRLYALQTLNEVENYIRHRLQVAGYNGPEIFNREAIEAIWHYSSGTPRLINIICDNALAIACEASKKRVSAYMVMRAASGLLLERGVKAVRQAPENGPSRVKPSPVKNQQRRTDAAGIEIKKTDDLPSASLSPHQTVEPIPAEPHVSVQFIDYMTRLATAAMGPMAHLVVRDQITALGETRDAFPQMKLKELIRLVSREILNEAMKTHFQEMMLEEIGTLKAFRA
ncbi:MAG TPA: AAA family ATPase [Candidatus Acidoferrales bacterium]|nr:AAA family ATPase [Candidatus Acidoferrales bacterium]